MDNTTNHHDMEERRILRRPVEGRMLAGVAEGLAAYLDIDVTLVRIVFAMLMFLGGAGVPLYVAAWLLIPEEGSDEAIANGILNQIRYR